MIRNAKKSDKLNVLVGVRVRPINQEELHNKNTNIIKVDKTQKVINCKARSFGPFDKVFDALSTQEQVFNDIVKPQVLRVLSGFNCTVFAYGQTGTGKTFTMEGGKADAASSEDDSSTGMTPRAVETIFQELEKTGVEEYSVRVSYLELYNEEIYDLLSTSALEGADRMRLRIYDDTNKKGAVIVNGAEEVVVRSRQEVYSILKKGAERRTTASTLMNISSSRSHSIFTITVVTRENAETGEELVKTGKLYLVDLAGSENISRSGAEGRRQKEAGNINQSLLTLGRVITSLTSSSGHIPYRESKLTRILQDSLGGSTITSIIATLSPASSNYEESLSTLEYAMKAKNIKNHPECNQTFNKKALLKQFNCEIEKLRRDLRMAREKNGIFLSEETYEGMEKDIQLKEEKIQELEDQLLNFTAKFQRFVEDMQMMDEMYVNVYNTNKKLHVKLEKRVNELDECKLSLARTEEKLAAHASALGDLRVLAKKCFNNAVEACRTVEKQKEVQEKWWELLEKALAANEQNETLVTTVADETQEHLKNIKHSVTVLKEAIEEKREKILFSTDSSSASLHSHLGVINGSCDKIVEMSRNQMENSQTMRKNVTSQLEELSSIQQNTIQLLVKESSENIKALSGELTSMSEKLQTDLSSIMDSAKDCSDEFSALMNEKRERIETFQKQQSQVLTDIDDKMAKNKENIQAMFNQLMEIVNQQADEIKQKTTSLSEMNMEHFDKEIGFVQDVENTTRSHFDVVDESTGNISQTVEAMMEATATLSIVPENTIVPIQETSEKFNTDIMVTLTNSHTTSTGQDEKYNSELKNMCQTASDACERSANTFDDLKEDLTTLIESVSNETKSTTSSVETSACDAGVSVKTIAEDWTRFEEDCPEKVHDECVKENEVPPVPKTKALLAPYLKTDDSIRVTKTRESMLEISNVICSPTSLDLRKQSRLGSIGEENSIPSRNHSETD